MKPFTIILAMAAILTMVTSCHSTQPVAHHADTLRVDRWHYDSIDRWHTRTIYQQGDTVHQTDTFYTDRWHIRWRDSIRTVHDSVPYPVEVVKSETDRTGWIVAAVISLLFALFVLLVSRSSHRSH